MTPKQDEKIRNKIARIRKELAADKKRWGGFYDDSRGLRYLPPELFIKLKDYKGGLRYLRWFNRAAQDKFLQIRFRKMFDMFHQSRNQRKENL
ncbi:MAG: hypothetical protein ACOCWC_05285 [Bacteroidota bacterium]